MLALAVAGIRAGTLARYAPRAVEQQTVLFTRQIVKVPRPPPPPFPPVLTGQASSLPSYLLDKPRPSPVLTGHQPRLPRPPHPAARAPCYGGVGSVSERARRRRSAAPPRCHPPPLLPAAHPSARGRPPPRPLTRGPRRRLPRQSSGGHAPPRSARPSPAPPRRRRRRSRLGLRSRTCVLQSAGSSSLPKGRMAPRASTSRSRHAPPAPAPQRPSASARLRLSSRLDLFAFGVSHRSEASHHRSACFCLHESRPWRQCGILLSHFAPRGRFPRTARPSL